MNWQQLKDASIDVILKWAEVQPWCQAMAACPQDTQWHAEGDVWTHTKMVIDELQQLEQWSTLSKSQQSLLLFVALFHDAAKPLTTEVDGKTGRIRSPKHAVKGEFLARNALREIDCDFESREMISKLVRYHGRPVFLTEKEEPTHEVARLSWLLNHRLLYLFALADGRGRDTDALNRPEENLHYWKLQAEELGCFEQPFPFASDHARFTFCRQAQPNLHYAPHESFRGKVTMLSGLPGSGKDTWITTYRSDWPVVSLDAIRSENGIDPRENQGVVAQEARERCREHLRSGTSFVFNATNLMRTIRDRWVRLFTSYDAHIEIVYIEPPLDQILWQNSQRSDPVPSSVIQKLALKCEPPTWLEAHTLTVLSP